MSDYVDSGYVDNGYVLSSDSSTTPIVTCDLTLVNTKLDLILTKLSLISSSIVGLDSRLSVVEDYFNTVESSLIILENKVNGIIIPDFSSSLTLVNDSIADTRNFLMSKVLTVDNSSSILPYVNEMSLRVYPNGTKVDVIGVDGICTVLSSSLTPDSDYLYLVEYTVKLDGTNRVSMFTAPVVTKHIGV